MKDVNDNKTAELNVENTKAGRPGRVITIDNFYSVLEGLKKYSKEMPHKLKLKLDDLGSVLIDESIEVYRALIAMNHLQNIVKDNEIKLKKYPVGHDYRQVVENNIKINTLRAEDYKLPLVGKMDAEIEVLQKIVHAVSDKVWGKMLTAQRVARHKKANKKEKIEIDADIFRRLKSTKEFHDMDWNEFMQVLYELSEDKKFKNINESSIPLDEFKKLDKCERDEYVHPINMQWLSKLPKH